MTVREATAADLPAIRVLQTLLPEPVEDLFADGLPPGRTFVAVPDAAAIAARATGTAARPGGTTATPDGTAATPVGYVHAYDTGYVAELAVAPDHRGRGHGRALLERALAALAAAGVAEAELEVAADNDRAISLYETLGFQIAERLPGRYEDGDGLRMTVALADA